MQYPTGMAERYIDLSSGQIAEHGRERLEVVSFDPMKQGDGWVTNTRQNGHLAGYFVHKRSDHDKPGHVWHYELVSAEETMLQAKVVQEKVDLEQARLVGSTGSDGRHVPGEIETVRDTRAELAWWVTLSPERIQFIKDFYVGVLSGRQKARNTQNAAVGTRAAKLSTLKDSLGRDNPYAMMAMTHPLTDDMVERYGQLTKISLIGNKRKQREQKWLFIDEALMLKSAQEFTDKLLDFTNQRDYDTLMAALINVAGKIRFRVQPFNQLAAEFHAAGIRGIDSIDPDMLRRFQVGMGLGRHIGYLLQPFQYLSGFKQVADFAVDEQTAAVEERLAALEEMPLTGAYRALADRVQAEGAELKAALHSQDAKRVRLIAKKTGNLLVDYCEPRNDPTEERWYGRRLWETKVLARSESA